MARLLVLMLGLILLAAACTPSAPVSPTSAPAAKPAAATSAPAAAPAKEAAAPAAPAKPAPAAPKGTVTVIQAATIQTLDSTMENGMPAFNPAINIFDTLLWRDETGNLQPFLATEWSSPDDKTIRMKLRPNVKFHNGDVMTADDVVYTWKRVLDPNNKSLHRSYVVSIADVRAIDPLTVEFQLKNPDATILGRFALIPILPKKVYDGQPLDALDKNPIGTGPFKFKEWVKGQRIVMEANLDYWRGAPKIQTLVYRAVAEANTRITELLTGNADVVNAVPPELAERIKSDSKTGVQEIRSLRNVYFKMNTNKPPFNDVRVRRAINHAIDVNLITSTILGGYGIPTPGGVEGVGVWGHNPNIDKGYEYNPTKAKQLLAEAGVQPGTKITFLSAQGRLMKDTEVVQAMAAMLEQVGFKVELKFMDFDIITNEWHRKYNQDLDLHIWSNANNTADADYNYSLNYYSKGLAFYWSTPEMDAMIEKAKSNMNRDARLKQYADIATKIFDEAPVGFLYDQVDAYGVSKRLENFKARPDELIDLRDASVSN